jgi:hypothetical protein
MHSTATELAPTTADQPWKKIQAVEDGLAVGPPINWQAVIPDSLSWLRSYVLGVAEELQVPPELPMATVFGAVSFASLGAVEIELKPGYRMPTAMIWVASEVSGSRKSSVLQKVGQVIANFEMRQKAALTPLLKAYKMIRDIEVEKEKRCRAILANPLSPSVQQQQAAIQLNLVLTKLLSMPELVLPEHMISDATPEALVRMLHSNGDHRLGVLTAEGDFLEVTRGRYSKNPAVEVLNKSLDGEPITVHRSRQPPIHIDRPLIAGASLAQPVVAQRILADALSGDRGWTARIQLLAPASRVGDRTYNTKMTDPALVAEFDRRVEVILNLDRQGAIQVGNGTLTLSVAKPVVIRLQPEAAEVYANWVQAWEQRLHPQTGDLATLDAWARKAQGVVGRIAVLLNLLDDHPFDPIPASTIQSAIAWVSALAEHLRALRSYRNHGPVSKAADYLIANSPEKVTRRDLMTFIKVPGLTTAAAWTPIIKDLIFRGYLRPDHVERSGPGRPSEVYEVNPVLKTMGWSMTE